jgi:hypothetical protein
MHNLITAAAMVAVFGFGTATGLALQEPTYVYVIDCSTGSDCEEKNPQLDVNETQEPAAIASRTFRL